MTKHLISAQRYHLFVEHQNRGTRKEKSQKEIAAELGKHPSIVSREYRRISTPRGGYNDTTAQAMADQRRHQESPHNKTPRLLLWRIEQWITEGQWSPAQIVGRLAKEGTHISKQSTYNHIYADTSGKPLANTRHKGKYTRKNKKDHKPTKAIIYQIGQVSMSVRLGLTVQDSETGRWILSSARMATAQYWSGRKEYIILYNRKASTWKECKRDCQGSDQAAG